MPLVKSKTHQRRHLHLDSLNHPLCENRASARRREYVSPQLLLLQLAHHTRAHLEHPARAFRDHSFRDPESSRRHPPKPRRRRARLGSKLPRRLPRPLRRARRRPRPFLQLHVLHEPHQRRPVLTHDPRARLPPVFSRHNIHDARRRLRASRRRVAARRRLHPHRPPRSTPRRPDDLRTSRRHERIAILHRTALTRARPRRRRLEPVSRVQIIFPFARHHHPRLRLLLPPLLLLHRDVLIDDDHLDRSPRRARRGIRRRARHRAVRIRARLSRARRRAEIFHRHTRTIQHPQYIRLSGVHVILDRAFRVAFSGRRTAASRA